MKVSDKMKIEDKEYMCTQILFLEKLVVYRVHEIYGNSEMFIQENDNNFQKITDKKILKEIYELIKVKNTDVIIS